MRRRALALVAALVVAFGASAAETPKLVLDGVTVVDVESGRLQPGMSVIVEGDRIAEVSQRAAIRRILMLL